MPHSFVVYIDESGDEGFQFEDFPKGSSRWFVLSALIVPLAQDRLIRQMAAEIRASLGFPERHVLHFSHLDHERRVCAVHRVSTAPITTASVLVQKEKIRNPETFRAQAFRLYFYTTRLLLERVSWFCRDYAASHQLETAEAQIIFEHRRRLSYEDLKSYLLLLRTQATEDEWLRVLLHDVRIHWPSINPVNIQSAQKQQYAGLQLADLVASGTRWALDKRYGNTEHRFAKTLKPVVYAYRGRHQSYGLKFFPEGLSITDPTGHWVRKHFR